MLGLRHRGASATQTHRRDAVLDGPRTREKSPPQIEKTKRLGVPSPPPLVETFRTGCACAAVHLGKPFAMARHTVFAALALFLLRSGANASNATVSLTFNETLKGYGTAGGGANDTIADFSARTRCTTRSARAS